MPIPFCIRDRVTGKHCWEDDLEPCAYCVLISELYHESPEAKKIKEYVYGQTDATTRDG